jgi:nitroreductase
MIIITFVERLKKEITMKKFGTLLMGVAMTAALSACGAPSAPSAEEEAAQADSTKNPVIETIMARRSVRKYKEQPVEREKLQQIVECGINAPSGMNKQPWEVRVVDNAGYIDSITTVFKAENPKMAEDPDFKNMFRNAPAVIFVASPAGEGQLDCGLLGENMMIAAQSLGLGTCCLGGPIHFMKESEAAAPYLQRLGLSEGYELLYAIAVGYPDESPEAKPRDASKVLFVE